MRGSSQSSAAIAVVVAALFCGACGGTTRGSGHAAGGSSNHWIGDAAPESSVSGGGSGALANTGGFASGGKAPLASGGVPQFAAGGARASGGRANAAGGAPGAGGSPITLPGSGGASGSGGAAGAAGGIATGGSATGGAAATYSCTAGTYAMCVCDTGIWGAMRCRDDGMGFDPCECRPPTVCAGTACVQSATRPQHGGGVPYPACCTPDDHCGIDLDNYNGLGCVALDQPGTPSSACAEVADPSTITMFTPEPVRYAGCCRPNGRCGFMMTLFSPVNFGCVDAKAWGFPQADVPCELP